MLFFKTLWAVMSTYWFWHNPPHAAFMLIPEYDPNDNSTYPGGIRPGYYSRFNTLSMIISNRRDNNTLQFILDMLEK